MSTRLDFMFSIYARYHCIDHMTISMCNSGSIHFSDCRLSQDSGKWVFGRSPWQLWFPTINKTRKQYSLLDTIFNYIFCLRPPGKHVYLSPQNLHMSAGEAGRHVVGCFLFVLDIFLEVQDQRYSQILYLINYIAYGFYLWYIIWIFKDICWKPI